MKEDKDKVLREALELHKRRHSSSGSGEFVPTNPSVKYEHEYDTEPIPAMKTVDKPAPAALPPMMPGSVKPLAGIIEVPSIELHGKDNLKTSTGTEVAFQKIFKVNEHNYLFTSKCCMDCIKVKHKKMLRAYLISHGMKDGSIKLWWKVWRATR